MDKKRYVIVRNVWYDTKAFNQVYYYTRGLRYVSNQLEDAQTFSTIDKAKEFALKNELQYERIIDTVNAVRLRWLPQRLVDKML